MPKYDYIIIGAGAAGLLLADALGNDSFFSDKSILILDKDNKSKNDRTWCFWEKGIGDFDGILFKNWPSIFFGGKDLSLSSSITPYRYKMLRGIDFYEEYKSRLNKYSNIQWVQDEVLRIEVNEDWAAVSTQTDQFSGKQVFNSIFDSEAARNQQKYPIIQQHFLGWFVKTPKPVFNPNEATFMDFSVPQKGNTRFMYVLPFSETEALVEYTLFSENILEKYEYEEALKDYLKNKLDCEDFEITDTERGSIPMTSYPFHKHNSNRVFNIGIAGGWTKPSTGFTFYNTYKQVKRLVNRIKLDKGLTGLHQKKRFWFYDLLLLDILYKQNHLGSSIFESLFKKRSPQLILKFLEEETSVWEDLQIIWACPKRPFLKALWNRLF
ncbi:lycopene cyclase family protein [Flagellimonas sp.]|uniref:lycopene cyclase family protein n=1 Tax=Flagellimonas sp. TaxID=2058762 RepID=UPI003BB17AD6